MAQDPQSATIVRIPYIAPSNAPADEDNADQYPESIPRYVIETFSIAGDLIFDPFIGFGTTAFIAEELGRIPYGIEADPERHAWAAGQITHWQNIASTDALNCAALGWPLMDLCVTSPPFTAIDFDWNPLSENDPETQNYVSYLDKLEEIFAQVKKCMKSDTLLFVHVDDVQSDVLTPLINDMKERISKNFTFKEIITLEFDENAPEDYPQTQLLKFAA